MFRKLPRPQQSGDMSEHASFEESSIGPKYYEYMLELINRERHKFGVSEVVMGDNRAAQIHAKSCLDAGVVSHWNLVGLKPYVRYSLTRGYQNNGENWFGSSYWGGSRVSDLEREIEGAMQGLMNSPGHRATILDKWYRKVNIGLTCDYQNFVAIQHFEGDFVEFDRLPTVVDGILRVSGRVKSEVSLGGPEDIGLDLWFDPPPVELSKGQLLRVNGYDEGTIVAALRWPLPEGYVWEQDWGSAEVRRLNCPEDFPFAAPEPASFEAVQAIKREAYQANQSYRASIVSFPFITAQEWSVRGSRFSIVANIKPVIERSGTGIYSLALRSPTGQQGDLVNISRYSLLVNLNRQYHRRLANFMGIG